LYNSLLIVQSIPACPDNLQKVTMYDATFRRKKTSIILTQHKPVFTGILFCFFIGFRLYLQIHV